MSSQLQLEYNKWSERFEQLSPREQLMILLCAMTLVAFVSYFLLLDPQWTNNQKIRKSLQSSQQELTLLSKQSEELSEALRQDPNLSIKQRISDIKQQINTVDAQLELQTASLVSASNMPLMLEQVLANSSHLKVLSLQSLEPDVISLPAGADKNATEQDIPALYRHGVKLVIEGGYADVQSYLEKLEALPWQFYWQRFDYQVNDYPLATVELEIYTLSTNKAFIGV